MELFRELCCLDLFPQSVPPAHRNGVIQRNVVSVYDGSGINVSHWVPSAGPAHSLIRLGSSRHTYYLYIEAETSRGRNTSLRPPPVIIARSDESKSSFENKAFASF